MVENNAVSKDLNAAEDTPPSAGGSLAESVGTSVAVPETDPERIAYNLWNEGRVDEAIQFLDDAIAARRQRRNSAGDLSVVLSRLEPSTIPPVSDWRERHRSALSTDFNAYGAAGSTLELSAQPADAIVPHPPNRAPRAAWILGLCLAAAGVSGAALLWGGRAGEPAGTSLPVAVQAASEVAPVAIVPATEVATTKPDTNAAPSNLDQPSAVEAAGVSAAADAEPQAEDKGTPASDAGDVASAESVPDAADTPPDDEMPPPGNDVASDTTDVAPETTASIDASAPENAALPETRLPRQRPEPPAHVAARPARTHAASRPSNNANPRVVYAPNRPPAYAPSTRGPFFDPLNHRTLTPAEYQALLERRAFAQNYTARKRAMAQRRIIIEDPLLGEPGPLIRLPGD